MKQIQSRQNYLGPGGWIRAGKYKLERYLYLIHRITGVGLFFFLLIHLIETTVFRIQGEDVWEDTMALFSKPWFEIGLYLVTVAFIFHALNGLRLISQELGFALGRPTPPIYPFKDAIRKRRPATITMLVVVVILALVALFDVIV